MTRTQLGSTVVSIGLALALSGCPGGVGGTYTDQSGALVVDLKSGGQATVSLAGEANPCTYTVTGDQLTLNCKGDANKLVFTARGDSLTGPPEGLIRVLHKKK